MRRKPLLIALATIVALALVLTVLNLLSFWQINGESGTFSMASTLPPCDGEVLAEGFTYHFRDPHRGEIVMFRARARSAVRSCRPLTTPISRSTSA